MCCCIGVVDFLTRYAIDIEGQHWLKVWKKFILTRTSHKHFSTNHDTIYHCS